MADPFFNYGSFTGYPGGTALEDINDRQGGPTLKHDTLGGASPKVYGNNPGVVYSQGAGLQYATAGYWSDLLVTMSPYVFDTGAQVTTVLRLNTSVNTMYVAGFWQSGSADSVSFEVRRVSAGTSTTLGSVAGTVSRVSNVVQNVIKVREIASTNTFEIYNNDVLVLSVSDPSPLPSTSRFGFLFNANTIGYTGLTAEIVELGVNPVHAAGRFESVLVTGGELTGGNDSTTYQASLYRSTDPTFGTSTLIKSGFTSPFTDDTAERGQVYYYRVTGVAEDETVYSAVAAGARITSPVEYVSPVSLPRLNILGLGTSIDYGAGTTDPATKAPLVRTGTILAARAIGTPVITNKAWPGYGLIDYLSTNSSPVFGGPTWSQVLADYAAAVSANPLHRKICVFGGMGPNDAAFSGKSGSPLSRETFKNYYRTVINQVFAAYSDITIVINRHIWHSLSVVGGYTYVPTSLKLLEDYWYATLEVIAEFELTRPGQVLVGDTDALAYFANNPNLFVAETGGDGKVFRLHPDDPGSLVLAQFQSRALFNALVRVGIIANKLPTTFGVPR